MKLTETQDAVLKGYMDTALEEYMKIFDDHPDSVLKLMAEQNINPDIIAAMRALIEVSFVGGSAEACNALKYI